MILPGGFKTLHSLFVFFRGFSLFLFSFEPLLDFAHILPVFLHESVVTLVDKLFGKLWLGPFEQHFGTGHQSREISECIGVIKSVGDSLVHSQPHRHHLAGYDFVCFVDNRRLFLLAHSHEKPRGAELVNVMIDKIAF